MPFQTAKEHFFMDKARAIGWNSAKQVVFIMTFLCSFAAQYHLWNRKHIYD